MRLVYTLLASGFLIFAEVPVEQPLSLLPHNATVYTGAMKTASVKAAPIKDSRAQIVTSDATTSSSSAWHLGSSPDSYLGFPIDLFLTQSVQDTFEPRKPPALSSERSIRDGPMLFPPDYMPPPTPLPPKAFDAAWAADAAWLVSYDQPSLLPVTGVAMYYNPEVMQEVLSNRLAMGHVSACPECIGYVALLRAGDLNRRVWLQWADGVIEGPFLVIDVAAQHHIAQLLARNWVVDVDYRTALRRSMINPVAVTVLDAPPEPSE